MSYIGEWEGYGPEFVVQLADSDGRKWYVQIEKSGGGELGEEYCGVWNWVVFDALTPAPGVKSPQTHGNGLHTGTPVNHLEAARLVLEFWEANS